MPLRSIPEHGRNQLESPHRDDVPLFFFRIVTRSSESPQEWFHFVSEGTQAGVSYDNGAAVNYRWRNLLWFGLPMRLTWLSDDERPARGHVSVPNIDRRIGMFAHRLQRGAAIWIAMCWLSDFTTALDSENARNAVSSDPAPDLETLDAMFLRNVTIDSVSVEADFGTRDLSVEIFPRNRAVQPRYPSLFY